MSAYTEQVTQITDADLLIDCLKESGIKEVQKHDTAIQLHGVGGDKRKETAEIVIDRKFVGGAANDIGFKKQPDGTFKAIISQYDTHRYNAAWMDNLKKNYAEKKVRKVAKANGLTFLGKTVTPAGVTKLQFVQV